MYRWFKKVNNYLSGSPYEFSAKLMIIMAVLALSVFLFACFEIYVPLNPISHETITFTVEKGWGDTEISKSLEKLGIIRSSYFFRIYTLSSFKHSELKAGKYILSSRMSTYRIAQKMARGDVIKEKIVIFEGWDINDMAEYFDSKDICKKDDFIQATNKDYSDEFDFLKDKPKDIGLEGFLFPDTYEISEDGNCDEIVVMMLSNFEKKLTAELRTKIQEQNKSIFDIITMASIIEKEVRSLSDKKIVSGILWKRIDAGMPLQVDCTINYITGKSDPGATIRDTKIDSPYNTYMYRGLPKGPISSPGINSITAALEPKSSPYWFYLSDGVTIFSKTLEEHNTAKAKYLD